MATLRPDGQEGQVVVLETSGHRTAELVARVRRIRGMREGRLRRGKAVRVEAARARLVRRGKSQQVTLSEVWD